MNRLRTEILDKVGPTRRPDYDDIRDMRYLRAVINGTNSYSSLPIFFMRSHATNRDPAIIPNRV